jgi:putative resolvase
LQEFTREQQFDVLDIIKDVGIGLNENRKGLVKLFRFTREQHMSYVLIEFRDRLTRFGYRYFMDYLLLKGGEVSVKEEGKNEGLIDRNLNKKLIEDLIATIYSVSG